LIGSLSYTVNKKCQEFIDPAAGGDMARNASTLETEGLNHHGMLDRILGVLHPRISSAMLLQLLLQVHLHAQFDDGEDSTT
jgi:hypothetical protein